MGTASKDANTNFSNWGLLPNVGLVERVPTPMYCIIRFPESAGGFRKPALETVAVQIATKRKC
jgi:hypothetical protein